MFIIPSKFIQNVSPIDECIDAITRFHPTEKILVVDSYSDDVSYLAKLVERDNVIISKYRNKNYECGALYCAYDEFPNEKYYALIQDSIILQSSWEKFLIDNITYNLLYFDEGTFMDREFNYTNEVIKNTKYNLFSNGHHIGMFGMMGVYKPDVMKTITEKNLLAAALPIDKFGSQMTERIFGICLMQDGHDLKKNSINGDFHVHYPSIQSGLTYFKKSYHGRM